MAATPPWKQYLDSLQIEDLAAIFRTPMPIIGMVHCWPLPGAPGYTGYGMERILGHALRDAEALAEGGCDGLIVENMWDVPFRAGPHIQPESIAAQAVVVRAVRERIGLPIGVNLVHNGGLTLLGIALAGVPTVGPRPASSVSACSPGPASGMPAHGTKADVDPQLCHLHLLLPLMLS